MQDLALLAELRGSVLQPGNFTETNVIAHCLSTLASDESRERYLDEIVAGQVRATWGGPQVASSGVAFSVREVENRLRLSGIVNVATDAHRCDVMVVDAGAGDDAFLFLIPLDAQGVEVRPLGGLDLTKRFSRVKLQDVLIEQEQIVARGAEAESALNMMVALAAVLTAADSIGAMAADLEMTVQYALDRTAFGRPIGSFQAVKHLLADTSLALECSKSIVFEAARGLGDNATDSLQLAGLAKAFVDDAGVTLAQIGRASCRERVYGLV